MYTLESVNALLKRHTSQYSQGKYRLGYHLMPVCGWMNDPHNPVYWRGFYHVFYNLYAFDCEPFAPKAWAHAITDNFVDYTYLPCAIAPDREMDCGGCASGCVVETDDSLYLVYTARNRNYFPPEKQAVAKSTDGKKFQKINGGFPVLVSKESYGENSRDPRIWKFRSTWYMLLGNSQNNRGQVIVYTSKNLLDWVDQGIFCSATEEQGFMWECPDYQKITGTDILILSPEGLKDKRHCTIYLTGSLSKNKLRFIQQSCRSLDSGPDFYSPQCFTAKNGKKMLIGWMHKWFMETPTKTEGWVGALTIPRELSVNHAGFLQMQPAKELSCLRSKSLFDKKNIFVENHNPLKEIRAVQFELRVVVNTKKTTSRKFELVIRLNKKKKQKTIFIFDIINKTVCVDRSQSGEAPMESYECALQYVNESQLDITLFSDVSSAELFINNGTTTITNRLYPAQDSDRISLLAQDGILAIESLTCFALRNAKISFNF